MLPAGRRPGHKRGAGYAVHVTREWRRFKDKLQSNPEKYSQYRQKCRDRMRMIRMRKKLERQRSGLQWTRNEKHSQYRQQRRHRMRMVCMNKKQEPPMNTQLEDRITETQGMKMTRERRCMTGPSRLNKMQTKSEKETPRRLRKKTLSGLR